MASEPEVFDCSACEFRQQVDGLDAENAEAWRVFAKLTAHRWVYDFEATAWWMGVVLGGLDDDDRDEMMARVSVIYDTLHPPQSPRHA